MTTTEDTSLAQRPLRGLRNTCIATVIVFVLTAILWCDWAWIAHRRLQAQIDAIAALHQPFKPEDFPTVKLPDDQNAAVLWQAVFAALPADTKAPSSSILEYRDYPPYPPAWHQLEDQSIVLNARVFQLADIAAAAQKEEWARARTMGAFPNYFNHAHEAANVLGDAAIDAHEHGDDALAIQRITEVLRLSRSMGKTGSVIGRLVAVGIEALGEDRLLRIAPDLVIQDGATHAAKPAQVESLIQLLLDESDQSRLRAQAIDWDRTYVHQILSDEKKHRWILGPLMDISEANILNQRKIDCLAALSANDPNATAIYRDNPNPIKAAAASRGSGASNSVDWSMIFEGDDIPLDRFLIEEWRVAGERRVAAVDLAIQLYRADHRHWPAGLAELVPDYLPVVPADPFSPDGSPIGYVLRNNALPDGADRPMLYFDLPGDANTLPLPPEPIFSWRHTGLQWRDVSRWYPPPAPPVVPSTGGPGFLPPIR